MRLLTFVVMLCAVALSSQAHAFLVTFDNASLNGAAVVNSATVDELNNVIDIDLDILQLHSPFTLNFTATSDEASDIVPGAGESYTVSVTTNNLASHPMNGFDVASGGFSGNIAGNVSGPLSSNSFAIESQPASFSFVRIGGLNGGGGQIVPGQSALSTLTLNLIQFTGALGSSSPFSLTFTANPEPATMLLGSLIVVPGVVAARRRRKLKADAKLAVLAV